jgi:hypothetical protein
MNKFIHKVWLACAVTASVLFSAQADSPTLDVIYQFGANSNFSDANGPLGTIAVDAAGNFYGLGVAAYTGVTRVLIE